MARLAAVIKHRKWELDEKRRVLAGLEDERDAILAQLEGLMAEYQQEAAQSGEGIALVTMGAYMSGVKFRQQQMEAALQDKDEEITQQHDVVTEAFQELKTFEVAEENRVKREAQKQATIEQNMLDEQGTQGYFRAQSNAKEAEQN